MRGWLRYRWGIKVKYLASIPAQPGSRRLARLSLVTVARPCCQLLSHRTRHFRWILIPHSPPGQPSLSVCNMHARFFCLCQALTNLHRAMLLIAICLHRQVGQRGSVELHSYERIAVQIL